MTGAAVAALALAGGYLAGSIPFGVLLTRMAGVGDIRSIGSGNIGATNVLRTGKKGLALATLLLDGAKGAVAVLIAQRFGADAGLAAAVGAIVGHVFPVWLGFKGGKGVATALGVYFALSLVVGAVAALAWLAAAAISRVSSLGGIASAIAGPIAAFALGDTRLAAAMAVIALVVVARHKDNIRRLIEGTEPRIGARS